MNTNSQSGGARRSAKRLGSIGRFTRKQALVQLGSATTVDDCARWAQHANKHVRHYAWARALSLSLSTPAPSTSTPAPVMSEFDTLVARFTTEGKKDPVKSARSSLAARAQAAQKRAAKESAAT